MKQKKISGVAAVWVLILFIISLAVLSSCSRGEAIRGNGGKIEFVMNGSLKSYDQVNAGVVSGTVKTYSFVATKDPTTENSFTIVVHAENLVSGNYSIPPGNGMVIFREGTHTASFMDTLPFVVTISSNSGGLVNGTFIGKLYNNTGGTDAVTNGRITNVSLQ